MPINECLNCGRNENQIPLIALKYKGENEWICSQCLPVLIHKPDQLVSQLAGVEDIEPSPHHDD
jgi:hypothetical protein